MPQIFRHLRPEHETEHKKKKNSEGVAPFVHHRLHCCLPSAPHHRVSGCKRPCDREDRGEPFFAVPAVVPSAAGAVAFAAAGFFVGAGVTRSPGGASVAAPVAGAAGVFVAVTVGAGDDSLSSLSSSRVLRQTRIPRSCPALPH